MEGSDNGIPPVLKTGARKGLQVRVLSPPPKHMNKHKAVTTMLVIIIAGILTAFILTTKITWSLGDENPGPKMIDCVFHGLWSPLLRIRIVINQSCAGI